MDDRVTARAVGVLFILATVAAVAGGTLVLPVEEAGTMAEVAASDASIVSGVLLELLMAVSVIGIAALFFPVLRRQDPGLAISYVALRTLEAVVLSAAAVSALVVLALARVDASAAQAEVLLAVREQTYLLGSLVALGAGALVLYTLLWRSQVVPSWLSVWGLAGAALILGRGVVEAYGVELAALPQGLLAAPIAINEMVLAVWLIVKGFDGGTAAAREARPTAVATGRH
jgi:hypothetical protein